MEQYKVITITHKNVSLSDLGNFIIPKNDEKVYTQKLLALKETFAMAELMYLLTCNRVTFFFTSDQAIDNEYLKSFFSFVNPSISEDNLESIGDIAQVYQGFEAVKHLIEVAGSLDSLVLGEREIPKQIRLAYDECNKLGLTKDKIRVAVKVAVQTAKRIFTDTMISYKPVSVVSLACDKLQKLHIKKDARFLIIGAGDTNTMMGKYLLKQGFKNFTIFNRTYSKAQSLATKMNGKALSLEELPYYSEGFDVMITCTGSTDPIVDAEIYNHLLQGEDDQKIIVDLAIPYDIHNEVIKTFNINYIEIEQLRAIAQENLEFRKGEVGKAKEIIREEMEVFKKMFHDRQIELAMRGVADQLKEVKDHALLNVFWKEIETMDPASREVMEKVLNYMEKKYIGIPIKVAKEAFSPAHPAHQHHYKDKK